MALKVLIAHTGQCLLADPEAFDSLDAFKTWVSKNSKSISQDQIHLNTNGKHVKFASLSSEKEVFIYDWQVVEASRAIPAKLQKYDIPTPPSYHVSRPPDTITDQNKLEAWKDLFKARQGWTLDVVADCSQMSNEAQKRKSEIEVIIKAASTAVRNIQKHVTTVDNKNSLIQKWIEDIRKVQDPSGIDWNAFLEQLRAVPVSDKIAQFITGHISPGKQNMTLECLVYVDKFNKAKHLIAGVARQLSRSSMELEEKVDEIYRQSNELVNIVSKEMYAESQGIAAMEPLKLLRDIENLAGKVSFDCKNVLQSQDPTYLPQASKYALLHTKTLIPDMTKRSMEMNFLLRSTTEIRNSLAAFSMKTMQQISSLTSLVSEVNSQLTTLTPTMEVEDALQTLLNVKMIPITYASFLAEGIRRKNWIEKLKFDSSTLANEMKVFQEEESKRRRKWQKSVGSILWGRRTEHNLPGLELNTQSREDDWPTTSEHDLEVLLGTLQANDPNSTHAIEVARIISDLRNPTKQQTKWAKAAFKSGSLHENSLGRSTLLLRGDDELIRLLQEEGQKTLNKLKTAESRVRRLENLLHQQTHVNRTIIENNSQLASHPLQDTRNISIEAQLSKLHDYPSYQSCISPRRSSTNHGLEDNPNLQRLLVLEAELAKEKERSCSLETEIRNKKHHEEQLRDQIEEVNSTKRDLFNNLEAQQREFNQERKSMTLEIKRMQSQKEELENILDQYLTTRDEEKEECQEVRHSLRTHSQDVGYQTGVRIQEKSIFDDIGCNHTDEKNSELSFSVLREENKILKTRLEDAEKVISDHFQIMCNAYKRVSPQKDMPEGLSSLSVALIDLIFELNTEVKSKQKKLITVESSHNESRCLLAKARSEIDLVKERLVEEKSRSTQSQEALVELHSKPVSGEKELPEERLQLSNYRKDHAEIKEDSEILRRQLVDEVRQVSCLKDNLATQASRNKSLEKESRVYRDKYEAIQVLYDKLACKLEGRTSKARDLSRRLSTQNDLLCKLLERLSYSVTREGKSIVIQRLPKPERSNPNGPSDLNWTLRRNTSAYAGKKSVLENRELEILDWLCNDDLETETQKYDAFLSSASYIDTEAFCETVSKRIKDLEYTAKKYFRDARLYRDKFHVAQKEAQGKIAFKGFKVGDLALFLPTRNQATGAWAAFNIGAPHYFLKEQESHKLKSRDWLLARIHKIEARVVDLSKSLPGSHLHVSDRKISSEISIGIDSLEDDNPFELSDGLRWYLIEAAEEKPGAPTTPGLGKCTVASTKIDATGSIRRSKKSSGSGMEGINKTLNKNLRSRRNSNNSKRSLASASSLIKTVSNPNDTASFKAAATTLTVGEGSDVHIIRPTGKPEESTSAVCIDQTLTPENKSIIPADLSAKAPERRSIIWDALWSLDLSMESGKK